MLKCMFPYLCLVLLVINQVPLIVAINSFVNSDLNHLLYADNHIYASADNAIYRLDPQQLGGQHTRWKIGPLNDTLSCLGFESCLDWCKNSPGIRDINDCLPNSRDIIVRALSHNGTHLIVCLSYVAGICLSVPMDLLHTPDLVKIGSKFSSTDHIMCRDPSSKVTLLLTKLADKSDTSKFHEIALFGTSSCRYKYHIQRMFQTPLGASFSVRQVEHLSSTTGLRHSLRLLDESYVFSHRYSFLYRSPTSLEYVFYVIVQPMSTTVSASGQQRKWVVRLARICIGDWEFTTYTEVNMVCSENAPSRVVSSAHFGPVGKDLAKQLNVAQTEQVLLVSFNTPNFDSRMKHLPTWQSSQAPSEICAFPISEIQLLMNQLRNDCLLGADGADHGPRHLQLQNIVLECAKSDTPSAGGSLNTVQSTAEVCQAKRSWGFTSRRSDRVLRGRILLMLPNDKVESITLLTADSRNSSSVLLMGTASGSLLMAAHNSSSINSAAWHVFRNVSVVTKSLRSTAAPESRAVTSLTIDREVAHVFTLTSAEIRDTPLDQCSSPSSCVSCTGMADALCGWCSGTRAQRCMTQRACEASGAAFSDWIHSAAQCPAIGAVQPANIEVDDAHLSGNDKQLMLNLSLVNFGLHRVILDSGNQQSYCCELWNTLTDSKLHESTTSDTFEGGDTTPKLRCAAPKLAQLRGLLSPERASVMLRLDLYSHPCGPQRGSLLAETKIGVMQCKRFATCSACTKQLGCQWQLRQHVCFQAAPSSAMENDSIRFAELCPRVRPVKESSSDSVLLQVQHSDEFAMPIVLLENLQPLIHKFVTCEFECGDTPDEVFTSTRIQVVQSSMNLKCPQTKLRYAQLVSIRFCTLHVKWFNSDRDNQEEKGRRLDNVTALLIELYKCNLLAERCDSCTLLLPMRYQCIWCQSVGCAQQCLLNPKLRFTRDELCSNPAISSIFPTNGTIQGNTLLTLHGYNLGRRSSDVKITLELTEHSVARDLTCVVLPDDYQLSRVVRCRLPSSGFRPSNATYRLHVTTANLYKTSTTLGTDPAQLFHVLTPKLTRFMPRQGQQRGGTWIHLEGENLDVGGQLSIVMYHMTLASGKCVVHNRTATHVYCYTTQFYNVGMYQLQLEFDDRPSPEPGKPDSWDWERSLALFEVIQNAEVYSVQDTLVTESGGNLVEVHGRHLRGVQSAQLRVHVSLESDVVVSSELENSGNFALRNLTVSGNCELSNDVLMCLSPSLKVVVAKSKELQLRKLHSNDVEVASSSGIFRPKRSVTSSFENAMELITFRYDFLFDNHSIVPPANSKQRLTVYQDAQLFPFEKGKRVLTFSSDQKEDSDQLQQQQPLQFEINGRYLKPALAEADVLVFLNEARCPAVQVVNAGLVSCRPGHLQPGSTVQVKAQLGRGQPLITLGELHVREQTNFLKAPWFIVIVAFVAVLFVVLISIAFYCYKGKHAEKGRMESKMNLMMSNLESKVANECKEAFAELQTVMTDLSQEIAFGKVDLPFRTYEEYARACLFPKQSCGGGGGGGGALLTSLLNEDGGSLGRGLDPIASAAATATPTRYGAGGSQHRALTSFSNTMPPVYEQDEHSIEQGLAELDTLLMDKNFLLRLIEILEAEKDFNMRDRVAVASLLTAIFAANKLDYLTNVLKSLLKKLIGSCMEDQRNPKLLFRRTEWLAEKLLANWLSLLLFDFLRDNVGENLYLLHRAMERQIYKGPVDAVTGDARYSLNEDKLLRQQVNYCELKLNFVDTEHIFLSTSKLENSVLVLDCDTITQVKEKIIDAASCSVNRVAFSKRILPDDFDLELRKDGNESECLILRDQDNTTLLEQNGEYRRLNTLDHYKVPDGAFVSLVSVDNRPSRDYSEVSVSGSFVLPSTKELPQNGTSLPFFNNFTSTIRSNSSHASKSHLLLSSSSAMPSLSNISSIGGHMSGSKNVISAPISYHLTKPNTDHHTGSDSHANENSSTKIVPEVYLNRILTMKKLLHNYIEKLFTVIFTVNQGPDEHLPLCIKYMFDFLDDLALENDITDTDVVHMWKSNSLPLRFWVNIVTNPCFILDVAMPTPVSGCLSVVAGALIDACSLSDNRLTKESPSAKLLFAKDQARYQTSTRAYYHDVKRQPSISDQEMSVYLQKYSMEHGPVCETSYALKDLYFKYILRYREQINKGLVDDASKKSQLMQRINNVHRLLSGLYIGLSPSRSASFTLGSSLSSNGVYHTNLC